MTLRLTSISSSAGGGPVHISSGMAALAWSVALGRRRGWGTAKLAYRPHSVSHIALGTVLLWFGWFGFNVSATVSVRVHGLTGYRADRNLR